MATLTAAATSSVEAGILRAAWAMIYAYLDAHRDESFGERLLDILTPLFGGAPPPRVAP